MRLTLVFIAFLPQTNAFVVGTVGSYRPPAVLSLQSEEDVDLGSVSDAEALLACRAYLQRKNRLGSWRSARGRRQSDSGFFWPDPTELRYLFHDHESEMPQSTGFTNALVPMNRRFVDWDEEEIEEDQVSLFDDQPPPAEFVRRSEAVRKRWQDPAYRERWYESRWGSPRKKTESQLQAESKLRQLHPDEFLAHPALAAMTEAEIADAIRSYVISSRRRVKSRNEFLKEREAVRKRKALDDPKLPRDALLSTNTTALELARKERSERAKLAYQQRRSSKPPRRSRTKTYSHSSNTPTEALHRIQDALDSNTWPSVEDVELVLTPARLSNRKVMLRRVLLECFGLRGKCVPTGNELVFATQSSIEDLGAFVLEQLKARRVT